MLSRVQIEVDQDVFERLQALAKPFVDTPSSVIRRLLDEAKAAKNPSDSKERGGHSEQPEMRAYITSRGVRLPLGRLQATYRKRGSSKIHTYEAKVTPRGIEFDGQVFDDPSPAGMRAKELAGAEGAATNTNGWEFWEYFDENKQKWISIDLVRQKESIRNVTLEDLDL